LKKQFSTEGDFRPRLKTRNSEISKETKFSIEIVRLDKHPSKIIRPFIQAGNMD
jgi:hypothetical protein